MNESFNKNIIIKKATEKDIIYINEITNFCIENTTYNLNTQTKSLEETKIWFDSHNNNYPIICAIYNNQTVGWASLSKFREFSGYDKTAETSVYVNNKFYKMGIGKLLLNSLEKKAIEIGYHCLISVITSENKPSIELHKKCGFEVKAIINDIAFKNDRYLDIVFMTKTLLS